MSGLQKAATPLRAARPPARPGVTVPRAVRLRVGRGVPGRAGPGHERWALPVRPPLLVGRQAGRQASGGSPPGKDARLACHRAGRAGPGSLGGTRRRGAAGGRAALGPGVARAGAGLAPSSGLPLRTPPTVAEAPRRGRRARDGRRRRPIGGPAAPGGGGWPRGGGPWRRGGPMGGGRERRRPCPHGIGGKRSVNTEVAGWGMCGRRRAAAEGHRLRLRSGERSERSAALPGWLAGCPPPRPLAPPGA